MPFIIKQRSPVPQDNPEAVTDPNEEFYGVLDGQPDEQYFGPDTMENLINQIKEEGTDVDECLFLPAACARKITLTQVVEFANANKKANKK